MRYRFAREGVKTIGSQAFFEPESIKWDPEKVFKVNFENDFSNLDRVIGEATDLRREDDGWLTVEITWNAKGRSIEEDINKNVWLTVMVNHLVVGPEERTIENAEWRVIKTCDLRVIYATKSENPWLEEEKNYYCPECAAGKVVNCVGKALHPVTDELVDCASTHDFKD